MKNKILNADQIKKIVKRIAYQIQENNLEYSEIILIGVYNNGYMLAKIIEKELKQISKSSIELISIKINKKNPLDKIDLDCKKEYLKNKSIVLIDDVLHTGRTLIYCVKHLLDMSPINFNTVVLVDRNHKKFPIKVDFKGISLSTSMSEHVDVVFEKNESYVVID
ncbi:phosphoribosyltransferase family protein [Flavobacteriaceae bacterium]|nr:phosphoribosyltransferase family protein [Flavobacteriaceae bacterium]MDA9317816.1 phosphoribosyltransferase family protein [Flavobacteriaceae bacterium]MDB0068800.1 phosphoribosyltransferase family protein [Flavobacteriaceae bacterium]MDB4092904.1 phosphoribosyltransferase family protein [Flavobacteriaceae bacterium]MDB9849340.1 phosphoribosyltransferase family protein [Flavobacteriaceae bacterium]